MSHPGQGVLSLASPAPSARRPVRLASSLDRLGIELLRDVYDHAAAGGAPLSQRAIDRLWEETAAASVLPASVVGEIWLAALELATREDTAFGLLCRAVAASRARGVTWEGFLGSLKELKESCAGTDVPDPN